MAEVVSNFFNIVIAEGSTPPANMGELIPYLLNIFVGVAMVAGVFRVIGKLADVILNYNRWR